MMCVYMQKKTDQIIITMVGSIMCVVKGELYQVYWPAASTGQIQTAAPRTTNTSTEH